MFKKATLMEGEIGKAQGKLFIIRGLKAVYFGNSSCSLLHPLIDVGWRSEMQDDLYHLRPYHGDLDPN